MVVGRLQPQGEGNDHEDVEEVLWKPGQDKAAVLPPDALHHQHREYDVAHVEHNHEPPGAFHCAVHVCLEEREEELRGVPAAQTVADVDDWEGAEEYGGGGAGLAPALRVVVIVPRGPARLHHGGGGAWGGAFYR